MGKIYNKERNGYVGRGALKLKYALEKFNINIGGKVVADLGSSTGGFVEVLLEEGARKIYAVDTAYGQLEWKIRQDKRVVVRERTNALHVKLPEKVDLVTIDTGWTTQKLIIPKAMKLLKDRGQVISLVKPHYEAKKYGIKIRGGKLEENMGKKVLSLVVEDLKSLRVKVRGVCKSPIIGGKGQNIEYLVWINKK